MTIASIGHGVPALAGDTTGVSEGTIKIGVFGTLTGPAATFGSPTDEGVLALYKQANDLGGINGRKIEIVHEDDGCDPAKAVAAVKRLIHRDKVFALHGGACSASTFAVRQEIIGSKVPFVVLSATQDNISSPTDPYIFFAGLPSSYEGAIYADFAAKLNAKKVAIVKHADEWSDAKVPRLLEGLKAKGMTVVANEQFDRGATDATPQVLRLIEAKPDAVVAILYPAEAASFLRDAYRLGLKSSFILPTSSSDLIDLQNRIGSKEAMAGVYAVSPLIGPPGSTEIAKYEEIFKKYYPSTRVQTNVFHGMAGTNLMLDALKRAGTDLSRESFLQALNTTDGLDAGSAPCKIKLTPEQHQGCFTGTVFTLKDDKVVVARP